MSRFATHRRGMSTRAVFLVIIIVFVLSWIGTAVFGYVIYGNVLKTAKRTDVEVLGECEGVVNNVGELFQNLRAVLYLLDAYTIRFTGSWKREEEMSTENKKETDKARHVLFD